MIEVGVYGVDITPPVGIPLVGFAKRDDSTGILDSLRATALVAAQDDERVALVDCDLLYVTEESTARVRDRLARRIGIPADHVALMATHTHYGPDVCWNAAHPVAAAYLANLEYLLAGVVEAAAERVQPVVMSVGWGSSDIGINRRERTADGRIRLGRNPEGPVDRTVGVCRIDSTAGDPVVTIVNFQAHPVSLTGSWRKLSAGFPGVCRRVVKRLTGAPCLYVQGGCGDINPVRMAPDPAVPRSLGTRLACEGVRVWETLGERKRTTDRAAGAERVTAATEKVNLPRYLFGSRERAVGRVEELRRSLEELTGAGALAGLIDWTERRLARAERAVAAWDGDETAGMVPAEFQAIRLGPLVIAGAPGEIFNELAAQVRWAAAEKGNALFFASNTNGTVGYVPVREAYTAGGYEVDDACQVAEEAGEVLVDTCSRLVDRVS